MHLAPEPVSLAGSKPVHDPSLAALAAYLPTTWPPSIVAALDLWRQGHLVPAPLLLWGAPRGQLDLITGLTARRNAASVAVAMPAETWAVITSQTCDIPGTGPGARHPTVQVSPVVRVDDIDEGVWKQLVEFDMADRAALSPPSLAGRWVADLRISVPVSKSHLVYYKPVEGLKDEAAELDFAEHVATKVRRPALHDFLSSTVHRELRAKIKKANKNTSWWSNVIEVRLLIRGRRLAPTHVQLLILTHRELNEPEFDVWMQACSDWNTRARKTANFEFTVPIQVTLDECKVELYRKSIELALPELRQLPPGTPT